MLLSPCFYSEKTDEFFLPLDIKIGEYCLGILISSHSLFYAGIMVHVHGHRLSHLLASLRSNFFSIFLKIFLTVYNMLQGLLGILKTIFPAILTIKLSVLLPNFADTEDSGTDIAPGLKSSSSTLN